ncbi:MAG: hypothetical protein LBI60_03345 [Bacteroidales bacterium]|jgi:hypothetical protein|nr:hypothetical protein [Bacteroidales bacterium]
MKTLVILLSKTYFPQHPKAGKKTYFSYKTLSGLECADCGIESPDACDNCSQKPCLHKIHTCRSNYEYWKKKIDCLKAEGGVLSVREWSERPYKSKQETIINIPSEIIGIQKLTIEYGTKKFIPYVDNKIIHLSDLAENDGLGTYDYIDWFKPVFEKEKKEILDFVIIHFTKFRY